MRRFMVVMALVLAAVQAAQAQLEGERGTNGKRLALVIGNTDYRAVEPLRTASIDARAVAAVLTRQGFDVRTAIDLDAEGMARSLRDFAAGAVAADVGAVFFFGHGVQADGRNYLLPVSAGAAGAADWAAGAVPLDSVVAAVARARRLGLVLLDASRESALAGRNGAPAGLAPLGALPGHVVVGSAAQPGAVADDLFRFHSAYAGALLAHLDQPGLRLGEVLLRVRQSVINDTVGRQVPVVYGAADAIDVSFTPAAPAAGAAAPGDVAATVDAETALWQSVASSTDPAAFEVYLRQYPNGRFAAWARARQATLAPMVAPAPAAAAPPARAPAAAAAAAPLEGWSEVVIRAVPPPAVPRGAEPENRPAAAAPPAGAPAAPPPAAPEPVAPPAASAAAPPAGTAAAAAGAPAPQAPAAPGDPSLTEAQRRGVQRSLRQLGYYGGAIDGAFGRRTLAAIQAFQAATGAEPTGTLTRRQIATLNRMAAEAAANEAAMAPAPSPAAAAPPASQPAPAEAAPPPRPTSVSAPAADPPLSREQRREVQRSLERLGYYSDAIDGRFTPPTRAAIMQFQLFIGEDPTGILTPPQVALLNRMASTRRR